MALKPMQRFSFRLFGESASRSKALPKLEDDLRKARLPVRADAYLATTWMQSVLTGLAVAFILAFLIPLVIARFGLNPLVWVVVPLISPMAGYTAYIALYATPASYAKKRAKDIDMKLPYATNYISAMASAGVIPADVFRSLANQEIYGEVAREAAMVYKDLQVHGKDIITALRRSIARCPSIKYQEMLQGAITTITSGGDLTGYFRQKAARYQWENRVEQKSFMETMGLMAETYVTAAVAGPLFLIVMVAIIVLMGSGEMSQLQMIIYLLLPVINLGFMFGLKAMIPEV